MEKRWASSEREKMKIIFIIINLYLINSTIISDPNWKNRTFRHGDGGEDQAVLLKGAKIVLDKNEVSRDHTVNLNVTRMTTGNNYR